MNAKTPSKTMSKPLILVGTYRKECKTWIQNRLLYPYPLTLPSYKPAFNPKRIGSIFLYNRNSGVMKFAVQKVKTIELSDLWHYDYPVSSNPRSKKYLLFSLAPHEDSKSVVPTGFAYDERIVVSLNDVTRNNDDRAILSHWLHSRNTESGAFYKKQAKKLLPRVIFDFLADKASSVKEDAFQQTLFPEVFRVPFPPPENPKFTFIDLFAGIGGIRLGFQEVGGKCVFSSEWNPAAAKTYEANFGEMPFGDITKIPIEEIPDFDILLAGFPCQPFSIIGAKKGFEHETQGTLFFNIERILLEKQPRAFMLENVRNLTAHDKGKTFQIILRHLEEAGYHIHYQVLNALDYGVPQKRERIFICGFKQNVNFEFPQPIPVNRRPHIKEILEPDEKISPKLYVRQAIRDSRLQRLKVFNFSKPYLSHENVAGAITPHHFSCALRAGASANYLLVNDERRLSERELLRLQGFPDEFRIVVNYGQIRQQTGNSVAVPVVEAVAKQMIRALFGDNANETCRRKKSP